jgi:capsular exopolysaccharide synthesis family protein
LQRREEAALGNASAIAAHRIVDWADATAALPSSKKIIVILAAFVLGCALCFVYIFYRENVNSRILFRNQLESQTSYPVAAEINYRKHRTPLLVMPEYKTAVTEQFRQLQASLNLFDRNLRHQKILVTSAIAKEGKSFTCLNLASSLAIAGKRVVVIDLNLLDPDIETRLQVNSNDGLIGFLNGTKDVRDLIRQSSINYLDVVPAGTKTINSMALLKHERLQVLFQTLEQQYDYILIDTPPVELATDAYLLSQYADITLFVVRHNVTAVSIVRQLDENPRIAQMQNLHLVFNGIKGRGFLKKYYGYGYGYGNEHVLKDRAYNFSGL